MEKKTVLYDCHVALNAKMVPFGGFLMPVQYQSGVIAEHNAVRKAAGLFDVSHMGEVLIRGNDAEAFLQKLLTNDISDMPNGSCRYSPMCNHEGGVVDDLIVYKMKTGAYMLVVNASNHEKDLEWMKGFLFGDVKMEDASADIAELAVQGPAAQDILASLCDAEALPKQGYTFVPVIEVAGVECLVSRTGYTGEDGFELYCNTDEVALLWEALLNVGAEKGLVPCGLAARDTLRLEAGMPLYGHEMSDVITPLQANLSFFVKMDKVDFVGKGALVQAGPPSKRRAGLKMVGRGIAREGCPVYVGEEEIGVVTSGTQLPFVGYAGAMAMLDSAHRTVGTVVEVDVRGRRVEAEVIKLPFYKRK